MQLGASIDDITPIRGFNGEDRKRFIPSPRPEVWFKYEGPLDHIALTSGEAFKADALYIAIDDQRKINYLELFPADEEPAVLADLLTREFGPGSVIGAGLDDPELKYYPCYLFYSPDKGKVVTYFAKTEKAGLSQLSFQYTFDMHTLRNYRLTYRTWAFL